MINPILNIINGKFSTNINKTYLITDKKNIGEFIKEIVKDKVFVFIIKEDYDKMNKEIKEQIDEISFEDTQSVNGEPPKVTLEDILKKDVVFVKINSLDEINEIIELRENITGKKINCIISL